MRPSVSEAARKTRAKLPDALRYSNLKLPNTSASDSPFLQLADLIGSQQVAAFERTQKIAGTVIPGRKPRSEIL